MYTKIEVKCGKRDMFEVQNEIEKLMPKSFKADGGGAFIGSNNRDIFFDAPSKRSVEQFMRKLKRLSYKLK